MKVKRKEVIKKDEEYKLEKERLKRKLISMKSDGRTDGRLTVA